MKPEPAIEVRLARIKYYLHQNRKKDAIDELDDYIEDLCFTHRFEHARTLLIEIQKSDLPMDLMMQAVISTKPWERSLGNERKHLILTVARTAYETGGLNKAKAILKGMSAL